MPSLWLLALLACGGSDTPAPEQGAGPAAVPAPRGDAIPDDDRPQPPADAPNVLVIVWDTVRADRMGLYGYDKPTTPRVDAWAKSKGIVYERAVSPGVWTLPSHASLFTALPVRSHGVNADTLRLPDKAETFAESFQTVGYDTYTFCANPYISPDTNILQGFDAIEHPWQPPWRRKVVAHMDAKLLADDASTPVSPKWPGRAGARNKYLFKESGPVAAEALFHWLDNRADPERPFFAFLNYMEAHLPRIPSQAARDQVMSEAAQERALTVEQTTKDFHEWMVGKKAYDALDLEAISGVYDASLIDLDAVTGDLLDALEARGLADDTIVVLTSDHGENLGDHDLLLHKYGVWNSLARVPLVVSWPGQLEPGTVSEPYSVADVLADLTATTPLTVTPTLQAFLDARPSADRPEKVVEFNAVPQGLLVRMKKLHPDVVLAPFQHTYQGFEYGPWKYTERDDGASVLFDVTTDPGELDDRSEAEAETTAELKARFAAWREAVPEPDEVEVRPSLDPELEEGLKALGYVE